MWRITGYSAVMPLAPRMSRGLARGFERDLAVVALGERDLLAA